MKYYLIAGEASGDLHASRLMRALTAVDGAADFRFFGGDLMAEAGGVRVRHYRELAYMGLFPVLLHLPTILRNMRFCKQDIEQWKPDVVILVDYPGFNLQIAKYVSSRRLCPVYYYIAPKIWAWKEYRIRNIKRDVAELFSILPFEVDFFERKHHFPIHYVGNPTADEVREYLEQQPAGSGGRDSRRVIALLAGSRQQEIRKNLPGMLEAVKPLAGEYRIVLAAAPAIPLDFYRTLCEGQAVEIVSNQTYAVLSTAYAALVTSGTATLETALFGVPQVVCYNTTLPRVVGFLRRRIISVPFVSLVNLIAGREVVCELVADGFSVGAIRRELTAILHGEARQRMLDGYGEVRAALGAHCAPDNAARIMYGKLSHLGQVAAGVDAEEDKQ